MKQFKMSVNSQEFESEPLNIEEENALEVDCPNQTKKVGSNLKKKFAPMIHPIILHFGNILLIKTNGFQISKIKPFTSA